MSTTSPGVDVEIVPVCDQPKGLVRKRGVLRKRGRRRFVWVKRYFVLEDHLLLQFSQPQRGVKVPWAQLEQTGEWHSRKTLDVAGCVVVPLRGGVALGFALRLPDGKERAFRAGDPQAYSEWFTAFMRAGALCADHSGRRECILRAPTLRALEDVAAAAADAPSAARHERLLGEIEAGVSLRGRTYMRLNAMTPVHVPAGLSSIVREVKERAREDSPRRPSVSSPSPISAAAATAAAPPLPPAALAEAATVAYSGYIEEPVGPYSRSRALSARDIAKLALAPPSAAAGVSVPRRPLTECDIETLALFQSSREEKGAREYYDGNAENLSDWNARFQSCIEDLQRFDSSTGESRRAEVLMRLINVSTDFLYAATTFGKIIVHELHLEDSEKTIKPLREDATHGPLGMAGGEKYICHGLYFKFARDDKCMYGSNMIASKIGGHELKSCINVFHCITWAVRGVFVPLMALLDYRGYRLIVESLLPINKQTIVYGSPDAGATIFTRSAEMNEKLKQIGKILHLQKRKVKEGKLYTAVDLEGHLGLDGKLYLIDHARMFPPETPKPGLSRPHLYRLLRPEFVMLYPKPLCPDAYSNFTAGSENEAEFAELIDEATQYLICNVIPAFATELEAEVRELGAVTPAVALKFPLCQRIHRRGINLRYLGLIRAHCTERKTRGLLLVEMIARVQKTLLNARLRQKQEQLGRQHAIAIEQPFRILCVEFFNLCLGNSPASDSFWNDTLQKAVDLKFDGAFNRARDASPGMLKGLLNSFLPMMGGKLVLFKRLQHLTGIRFSSKSARDLEAHPEHWSAPNPFDVTDLKRVGERVKHMQIVGYALGYLFMIRAKALAAHPQEGSDLTLARHFFELAMEKFEEGLEVHPNDQMMLAHCGEIEMRLAMLESSDSALCVQQCPKRMAESEKYFLRALAVSGVDSYARLRFAQFLELSKRYREAEDHYVQSLEIEPNNIAALREYARFLRAQGHTVEADRFQLRLEEDTHALSKTRRAAGGAAPEEEDDYLSSLLATRRLAHAAPDHSFSQPMLPFAVAQQTQPPSTASTPSTSALPAVAQMPQPVTSPPPPAASASKKDKEKPKTKAKWRQFSGAQSMNFHFFSTPPQPQPPLSPPLSPPPPPRKPVSVPAQRSAKLVEPPPLSADDPPEQQHQHHRRHHNSGSSGSRGHRKKDAEQRRYRTLEERRQKSASTPEPPSGDP